MQRRRPLQRRARRGLHRPRRWRCDGCPLGLDRRGDRLTAGALAQLFAQVAQEGDLRLRSRGTVILIENDSNDSKITVETPEV